LPLLYSIGKVTVGKAMILGWRPHVEGLEHIPATGGAVFAGNHLSVADELFLGSVVPRHLAFWAKSEYFVGKGIGGFLTKQLMEGLGAIKVERAGGRAALTAFDGAIPVLKAGDMVAVYPEGTRSPDGRLYRGAPAPRGWRWRPACRSSRSACSAPRRCSRSGSRIRSWSAGAR
jgi:1-acyl-sn-glycerol-3-phosphate acyltransferase